MLTLLSAIPELAERLTAELGDVRGQAVFAAGTEMAERVEDVLRRRTTVALKTSDGGVGAAELTAALMAEPLGWSQQIQEKRAREYAEDVAPVPQSRRQA